MRHVLWLAVFTLLAIIGVDSSALAQSACKNIYYVPPPQQLVLTPGQWNECFSAKQDQLNYVPLNVAGGTMQGKLILAPSTANLSSLNIPVGIPPNTPQTGDFWATSQGVFVREGNQNVGPIAGIPTGPSPGLLYTNGGFIANVVTPCNSGTILTDSSGNPLCGSALATQVQQNINFLGNITQGLTNFTANATAPPAAPTGTVLNVVGLDGQASRATVFSFNTSGAAGPFFTTVRADGTNALPTAVQSGDELGDFNSWAHNGTTYVGPTAAFRIFAAENWSSGHQGSYADIAATPTASTTQAAVMRFTGGGGMTSTGVTGGDKGAGTINVAGYYLNGTVLASYITLPVVPVSFGGTGQSSFTANLPLLGNGTGAIAQGTISGNTTGFLTFTGTLTNGNCLKIDSNHNAVDNGSTCGTSTGSVGSGVVGQLPIYTGTTVVGGLSSAASQILVSTGTNTAAWVSALGFALPINLTGGSLPTPLTGTLIQVGSPSATGSHIQLESNAAGNNVDFRRSNGSWGSPTATAAGDGIGSINGSGYANGAYTTTRNLGIDFIALNSWTASDHSGYVVILTTPSGSTTSAEVLRVEASGGLSLGGATFDATDPGAGAFAQNGPHYINLTTTTLPTPLTGTVEQRASASGTNTRSLIEANAAQGNLDFRRSNGTWASPTATAAGNIIGSVSAFGYANSAYTTTRNAGIDLATLNSWTSGDHSTYVSILTTPSGSTTAAEIVRFQPSGGLSLGNSTFNGTDPGVATLATQGGFLAQGTISSSNYSIDANWSNPGAAVAIRAFNTSTANNTISEVVVQTGLSNVFGILDVLNGVGTPVVNVGIGSGVSGGLHIDASGGGAAAALTLVGGATGGVVVSGMSSNQIVQTDGSARLFSGLAALTLSTYTQSGSGGATITGQAWMAARAVTPQQFGAKCDNSTNDNTAITNWFAALSATVTGHFVGQGLCVVTQGFTTPTIDGLFIDGEGLNSGLKYTGGTTSTTLITAGSTVGGNPACSMNHTTLRNFQLLTSTVMTAGSLLLLKDQCNAIIDRVVSNVSTIAPTNCFQGFVIVGGYQVYIQNPYLTCSGDQIYAYGDAVTQLTDLRINGGNLLQGNRGVHIGGNVGGWQVDTSDILGDNAGILIDQSGVAVANEQGMIGPNNYIDSIHNNGIGIEIADAGSGIALLGLQNTWVASTNHACIKVDTGVQYQLIMNGGELVNCGGDGILNNSTSLIATIQGVTIEGAGFTGSGWGINCNVANSNVVISNINFARSSTSGNFTSNCPVYGFLGGANNYAFQGSLNGTFNVGVVNSSTANNAVASLEVSTGLANAYAQFFMGNGAGSPQLAIVNGPGVSAGIRIDSSQNSGAPINLFTSGAGSISLYSASTLRVAMDGSGNFSVNYANNGTRFYDQHVATSASATACWSGSSGAQWIGLCTSDEDRKTNILPIAEEAMPKIMLLQPITYSFKAEHDDQPHPGFGARAVMKILPLAVIRNEDGGLVFSGTELLPYMVKGMQEQQEQVWSLDRYLRVEVKVEVDTLKDQIKDLRTRVHTLEEKVYIAPAPSYIKKPVNQHRAAGKRHH